MIPVWEMRKRLLPRRPNWVLGEVLNQIKHPIRRCLKMFLNKSKPHHITDVLAAGAEESFSCLG